MMTTEKLSERDEIESLERLIDLGGMEAITSMVSDLRTKNKSLEDALDRVKTVAVELENIPLSPNFQGNAYAMGLKTAGKKVTLAITLIPKTEVLK